jgi:FMN phosphatase YigB (HAD superfamily)
MPRLPFVHVYRPEHPNHQSNNPAAQPTFTAGGVDVHIGRRPPRVARDPDAPGPAPRPATPRSDPEPATAPGSGAAPFKAVIFDLDNTLADATHVGKAAFQPAFDAIRQANHGTLNDRQLQAAFDACWHTAFYTVAQEHGFSAEMTAAGAQAFRRLTVPENSGYGGYPDLGELQSLEADKFLVTSGFRNFQNSKIDSLGIRGQFKRIEIDDAEDFHPEPSPGKAPLFEQIRDAEHLQSSQVLIVGDNPGSEIAAGNSLGMPTVQVLRPRVQRSPQADYHIESLAELPQVILHGPPEKPAAAS